MSVPRVICHLIDPVVRQNSVRVHFQQLGSLLFAGRLRYEPPMFSIIAALTGTMLRVFRTRRNLLLENLILRSSSLCSSASVPGHGLLRSINSSGFLREGSGPDGNRPSLL